MSSLAGALSVLAMLGLNALTDHKMSGDVNSAITTVVTFVVTLLVGYFVPDKVTDKA
jgi:hypothetical protein